MSTNPMPVAVIDFKPMVRNSLRGFAKIRVGRSMIVNDVAVHTSHGKRWAQAPGKPQVGSDGVVRKDANGKTQFTPIIQWTDRDASDRFSEAVVDAVLAEYPGALDENSD